MKTYDPATGRWLIDPSDASRRTTKTPPGAECVCWRCLIVDWAFTPRFGHAQLFGIYVAVTAVIEAVKWVAA